MQEIRMRWNPDISPHEDEQHDGGLWMPLTPEAMREVQIIVDAANEVYGEGSHWIEVRKE